MPETQGDKAQDIHTRITELFTTCNASAMIYSTVEYPKAQPRQDGAHYHHKIQTTGVVRSALSTLGKNAVMKEVESGPRYCERDCHGDRESHREVSTSGDPFRRLLRDPRE